MSTINSNTQIVSVGGYVYFPVPTRDGAESWRPNLAPEDILESYPVGYFEEDYFSASSKKGITASSENAKAFGRALALAEYRQWTTLGNEGRWGYIQHISGTRRIRVGFVSDFCITQVEESYLDEKAGKWTAWTPHMIAAARTGEYRGLVLEEVAEGTWYVSGQTYPHRAFLKQQGGVWNPSKKAYKMTRGLTHDLAGILFQGITKYHILAAMLCGRKVLIKFAGGIGANEVRDLIASSFRQELWYITGYDWREFPRTLAQEAVEAERDTEYNKV